MINIDQLKSELAHFIGTENWYKSPLFPRYTYTDGVKYLAEQTNCYWLLDYIFSNQIDEKIQGQAFQNWIIHVTSNSAVIVVEDGDNQLLRNFRIPFTNFPLDEFSLWFTNNTLILPSEY